MSHPRLKFSNTREVYGTRSSANMTLDQRIRAVDASLSRMGYVPPEQVQLTTEQKNNFLQLFNYFSQYIPHDPMYKYASLKQFVLSLPLSDDEKVGYLMYYKSLVPDATKIAGIENNTVQYVHPRGNLNILASAAEGYAPVQNVPRMTLSSNSKYRGSILKKQRRTVKNRRSARKSRKSRK